MIVSRSSDFIEPARQVADFLWFFPPNKTSNGGVSWWLDCFPEPVLIDCPDITPGLLANLKKLARGRSSRILLTNRDGHGKVSKLQEELGWPVLVQEQEAFLLPGLSGLEGFKEEAVTSSGLKLLWTPGPSPGSCVIHAPEPLNVLFCGRLLIPVATDRVSSIRNKRTFHWTFQQKSLTKMCKWLPPESFPSLASSCPLGSSSECTLYPWGAWNQYKEFC